MRRLLIACLLLSASLSWATLATPTTVTSTSVASSTVTINSTAHGLSVGQGWCNDGSSQATNNTCGIVVTSSANSFTYTLQSGQTWVPCASSCGTVRPAPLVMWDQVFPFADPISQSFLACLWVPVTTGKPKSGATSACSQANASENAGLATGAIVEVSRVFQFPIIEGFANFNNPMLDFQTSAKNVLNGTAFTAPQPGAYLARRCDPTGCN